MSMMLAAALLASQAAATSAAAAPDWRPIGTHGGIAIDWDAASVERGDTVFVRVRSTPPEGYTPYAYVVTRFELRCAPPEGRAVRTLSYRADHSVVRTDDTPLAFVAIPPGSFFEALRQRVC